MHFNLFIIDTGHHEASWRLPDSDALAFTDVDYYERLAAAAAEPAGARRCAPAGSAVAGSSWWGALRRCSQTGSGASSLQLEGSTRIPSGGAST
ncbi:MAG TPA: hypothetical protein VHY58_23825 [Streptosporangiaceae bacterium]|jgi:hypothetical protein|nr:hypothetical protein [Streptosporangiaceae bacterium]